MTKIKNIEFLRIVGCLAIILLHLFGENALLGFAPNIEMYEEFREMTKNGQKAVDLFFILSGFFFILKLNPEQSIWNFVKHKLVRLYPVFIFVIILFFITALVTPLKFDFYNNILAILCLNGTSLVNRFGNVSVFWYVSALIWTLVFYFYLIKNYERKNVDLFIALTIFFCYSFLIHAKGGKINQALETFYFTFNVGMMRALAGIGVGYFIGQWYKSNIDKIQNIAFSIKNVLFFTGLEFILLYFIINNLMLHLPNFKNDFLFILSFIGIIVLFLIKKGFISKLLDSNICVNLSKYTYSFFLTHIFILRTLKCTVWKYNQEWVISNPVLNISLTLVLIFIVGILTYHFVELPCVRYFSKKGKE